MLVRISESALALKAEVLSSAVNLSGIRGVKHLIDVLNIPDLAGAACKGMNTELFFRKPAQAKRVCAGCPVKAECLESALEWDRSHPDRFSRQQGIVGGTDEAERRRLVEKAC